MQGGWYLLELINEILDLAQIESGQESLLIAPVNIQQVMRECEELMQMQAEKFDVTMHYQSIDPAHHILRSHAWHRSGRVRLRSSSST